MSKFKVGDRVMIKRLLVPAKPGVILKKGHSEGVWDVKTDAGLVIIHEGFLTPAPDETTAISSQRDQNEIWG